MLNTFMAYLDQFRAVAGTIAACFLFCRHAAPRREHYWGRLALYGGLCLVMGFVYVPLEKLMARLPTVLYGASTVVYWLLFSGLVVITVEQCYELGPCNALFRCLLGCTMESVVTTVIRYLIVMMWLPNMPQTAPVSYILLSLTIYVVLYYAGYYTAAKSMQQGPDVLEENTSTLVMYALLYLSFLLIMYSTNGITEWLVPMLQTGPAQHTGYDLIRYFCVGIRYLFCTAIFVFQHFVYEVNYLQRERDLVTQTIKERSAQYEFSQENIEFIRRKCHDLKRQLRALELADESERESVLEETRKAAEFYDATVHTGHEVLDTLLTEKNLLCANRGIRLSCAVSAREMGKIGAVDLYTMLSNALDNAIEAVEQVSEPGMKTIRFSLQTKGNMLHIEVENYYAGTIQMRDGVPQTSKADTANHGIGVKSIRTLARRYGGDIAISAEDQIFLLQIAIPLARGTARDRRQPYRRRNVSSCPRGQEHL